LVYLKERSRPQLMRRLLNLLDPHYFIAVLIIVIPLYPKFPLFQISGTFVSVRAEDFVLLVSLIVFSVSFLRKAGYLISNRVVFSMGLFLSVAALSVLSAVFVTQTVVPHIGLLHWLRRVEYFFPFVLALSIKHTKSHLKLYLACLVVVVNYAFVYGLAQKYFSLPIVTTQNQEYSKGVALRYTPGGHINSTFAGHYDLASFLILVLPLFYTSFFVFRDRLSKLLLSVSVVTSLWLLVNSVSRISIVSYLVAVTLSLALIKKYKAILVAALISLLFIAFSSNLLSRYSRIIEVTIDKISTNFVAVAASEESVPVSEDRSTSIRLNVEWPRALRALTKNPLLGTGFSSITLATDNDYLRLLGETGAVGFISFIAVLLWLAVTVSMKLPVNKTLNFANMWVVGFAGSFTGILLNAMFIDIFESSKFATMFWLFAGIVVSICTSVNANEEAK